MTADQRAWLQERLEATRIKRRWCFDQLHEAVMTGDFVAAEIHNDNAMAHARMCASLERKLECSPPL